MALTYDDGPGEPDVEDRLLAAAKSAKVRLTYFLLGKNVRHSPDVVRRMAEAGHEVGNHSFDHPQMSKKSPRPCAGRSRTPTRTSKPPAAESRTSSVRPTGR
ncbi:polysaccharide deacetylase family protein [Brevibacterium casei]|nr:polysaccharide deacetylase family protein [Brevibacterium casei]